MIRYIASIVLGMLPEVLYFTYFIIFAKNIKQKRLQLFSLISLAYIILVIIIPYRILFYISFIFIVYGIMKLLYRENADKIDIFMFAASTAYMSVISYICFYFFDKELNNYKFFYIVDRILLFCPFIFSKYFNKIYIKYRAFWNRERSNENKKGPKAITLRNISLIGINLIIVFMNYYFILMINFSEGR